MNLQNSVINLFLIKLVNNNLSREFDKYWLIILNKFKMLEFLTKISNTNECKKDY